jgi:small multidrug resistance pump
MIKSEFVFGWGMLGLAVISNTGASLALKWSSLSQYRIETISAPPSLIQIGVIVLALTCYSMAFIAYMLALRAFPVSFAYPFITSSSVVIVSISAIFIFNEPITLSIILGTLLILVGVLILMGGIGW